MRRFGFLVVACALVGVVALVTLLRGQRLVVQLDDDVSVFMRGKLPLHLALEQAVDVRLDHDVEAQVKLGRMQIPIDETIDVPLSFSLPVAIDAPVRIDDTVHVQTIVPIDTVLTEHELDLSHLEVPIDTDVFVDDSIALDLVVPIDTEVQTTLGIKVPVKAQIPIKLRVPVHQKIHVHDRMQLGVPKLRVPLHIRVPVNLDIPLAQTVRVTGSLTVPIKQHVSVPIKQIMTPDLGDQVPVTVRLSGSLPAQVTADIATNVSIDRPVQTHLGKIVIDASEVSLEAKPTH